MKLLQQRTIAVIANTSWYLWNFRLRLMLELHEMGYDVIAIAPPDAYSPRLEQHGLRFVSFPLNGRGTNPMVELGALVKLHFLLHRTRPDLILSYTSKANIYSSLAARLLGIPVVNNVAGLGYAFIRSGMLATMVKKMYKIAFMQSAKVFFQNSDDLRLFLDDGLVRPNVAERLPGSGVDLTHFAPVPLPVLSHKPFRFLLIARMLWDKGVGEFVEAARQVRQHRPDVGFCLLGFLDAQNPAAISRSQVEAWADEGVVTYLGATDDVRPHVANADCVVLPSYYREGVPRSLLEAASMGRPIITTDAIGCREVVVDGVNGYLCQPRDAADLADKMKRMLVLSNEACAKMGQLGREKVEREFDERIVIERYLGVIKQILTTGQR